MLTITNLQAIDPLFTLTQEPRRYFRHQDGGFYLFLSEGRDAESGEATAVYYHLWPFTPCLWTRKLSEFKDGRFTPVPREDVLKAVKVDQTLAQVTVKEAKALRKAQT